MANYLNIFYVNLPAQRPFHWRGFFILVILYFLGNLAGVPLLRATHAPIEPLWFWGVVTVISAIILGLSMLCANRVGLGAPILTGELRSEDRSSWLRTGLALTVLLIVASIPFSLWLNLNVDPLQYPSSILLILASVKAGIVEELFNRYFLVSLLVWMSSRFNRNPENPPRDRVYLAAIILAGLFFGWAHVAGKLDIPEASLAILAGIMFVNTFLGIGFGWLFWKLGIEWAILAHFAYDAVISAGLLKVYLSADILVWVGFLIILILATWMAWRAIRPRNFKSKSL